MTQKNNRYTEDFKKQIVQLYETGQSANALCQQYDIGKSTIWKWIGYSKKSGSFKTAENRSEADKELLQLRKENKQLKMENDILKQAALIMGRK